MLNSIWTGRAAEYDAKRDCWLNERRFNFICAKIRQLPAESTVLEHGCGTGWLLFKLAVAFPRLHLIGIDPDKSYIQFATNKASSLHVRRLCFIEGFAESLASKISENSIDCVLTNDVIHHVKDESLAVQEVFTVLKDMGSWLAIEPNQYNPYVAVRQALGAGEKNFIISTFIQTSKGIGFNLIKKEHLFLIPPTCKQVPEIAKNGNYF